MAARHLADGAIVLQQLLLQLIFGSYIAASIYSQLALQHRRAFNEAAEAEPCIAAVT